MPDNKSFSVWVIILLVGGILFLSPLKFTLFTMFFTSMPSASVIPNEINEGESSKVSFSALLREIGPQSGAYFNSIFIDNKNLCLNTAGTSNGDTYEFQCPISVNDYKVGLNNVFVYQGYGSSGVPKGCFSTYEGAEAYNNYKLGIDGGKLFQQCLWGTPNGETYPSQGDQRWYDYPQGSEFAKLCKMDPPGSGGGDSRGARYSTCSSYLRMDSYDKKILSLTVFPKIKLCAQDLKQCSDGSSVSRNSSNNCEFNQCPIIQGYKCPLMFEQPICQDDEVLMSQDGLDLNGCSLPPICVTVNNNQSNLCLLVITHAKNSLTNECKTFSNSCIPNGWYKVNNCLTVKPPTHGFESSQLLEPPYIYYVLGLIVFILLLWFRR